MRDPALHIRRSDLSQIFVKLGTNIDVDLFMVEARKYSIKNRVFVTTKAISKKKSDRSVGADSASLDRFNAVYMGVMLSNNIKVIPITKISPQHLTLKEVCWQAAEFCKLFSLGTEEGMRTYVEIGVKLLDRKFGVYRLKSMAQRITDYYQAKTLIKNDPDPDGTSDCVTAYIQAVKIFYHTSIILEDDVQRAHFIHVREDVDALKVDCYEYICAQFEKYAYLNSIPAFSQLYGDQAKLNYQIYMAKVKKDHTSKEEQDYFNKVKNNETTIKTKASVEKESIRKARLCSGVESSGSGGVR